jgi:L,D-transpeptidase YcbB
MGAPFVKRQIPEGVLEVFLAVFVMAGTASSLSSPVSAGSEVAMIIRDRLAAEPRGEGLVCNGEVLAGSDALRRFYERRFHEPAWTREGRPLPIVDDLISALSEAWRDGLDGETCHLAPLRSALEAVAMDRQGDAIDKPWRLADVDLLASDGFLLLASHLAAGMTDPATVEPEWFIQVARPDPAEALRSAVEGGAVERALAAMRPARMEYAGLREALRRCAEAVALGGWPAIPPGPSIRPGAVGPRVRALRERLEASGDLPLSEPAATPGASDVYDPSVAAAVRRFQARHGLGMDGVAGLGTQAALNIPAEERLGQIQVNLERWRWLPRDFGPRYIIVNAADFRLKLIEQGRIVLDMPVVVGKAATRTPVFDDLMTTIEINPVWDVPPSIAATEILDNARADAEYLGRLGYKLYAGWGESAAEVDPSGLDWSTLDAESFPYRVRQAPGPMNSLGRLAFLFPNPWAVYLHDTPLRYLFERPSRSFSHGCIRIAQPLELAVELLRDDPAWTKERILAAIAKGANQEVFLPRPIPIYIVYLTAWRDETGALQFRDDIYGRDATLARALAGLPPLPPEPSDQKSEPKK